MGMQAARKQDLSSGHSCFPPRPIVEGSSNVFTNSRPAVRKGDLVDIHNCGNSAHKGNIAKGSATVYINSKQAARVKDPITCGDVVMTGSTNVYIGG
jgi:uncharacterized Zn-binding protein involved in type VI secretion